MKKRNLMRTEHLTTSVEFNDTGDKWTKIFI